MGFPNREFHSASFKCLGAWIAAQPVNERQLVYISQHPTYRSNMRLRVILKRNKSWQGFSTISPRMSVKSHPPSDERSPRPSDSEEIPFSRGFFDKHNSTSQQIYLRTFISGCFLVIVVIFAIFPIFWGSLWRIPARNLEGWVVVSRLYHSLHLVISWNRITGFWRRRYRANNCGWSNHSSESN
jgi:hypothetical protein